MPRINKGEIRKLSAQELTAYEKTLSSNIADMLPHELFELAKSYSISNFTQARSMVYHIIELREEIVKLKRDLIVARSIHEPINNLKDGKLIKNFGRSV